MLKFILGFLGHSSALISDGIHSASDVVSSIFVIIGLKISTKTADNQHLYGHERLENVASIILAGLLFATGIGIGYVGIRTVFFNPFTNIIKPSFITLIVALISIIVKELMYHYTKYWAKKLDSSALMADAWHHRSDSLSSIASLIGIFFARMGYLKMDSISCIVISLFIVKGAYDIFKDSINKMIDKSCTDEETKKFIKAINSVEGVVGVDDIKTRKFGNRIYLDVEIACNGNLKLYDIDAIAEKVHLKMEKDFPEIKHCMVHVNPS